MPFFKNFKKLSLLVNFKNVNLHKSFNIICHRNFATELNTSEDRREYEGVVGLEVHAQINTKSKLFSSSPATFGLPTNTKVAYFDAALPGTLPVLNKSCVEAGILTALACNCTVNKVSTFDRKHYFYPDLPAGYQITQQFQPLASNGHIKFLVHGKEKGESSYECCAYLKQLQLEQDSGRSFHVSEEKSLVDLNRAGIALMELVFEPNLKNGTEAAALIRELIHILKRIGTCSCELEEGTLRVDANVSVNKVGDPLGTRTEVKNINSLRYIARAIDYEINRQIEILENGGTVINETRAYDYGSKCTKFMRDKEMLQDYRFMPEPNLPPIRIDVKNVETDKDVISFDAVRKRLPMLPERERSHLVQAYEMPVDIADKLVHSSGLREVFETIALSVDDYPIISNYLLTSVQSQLNARNLDFKQCDVTESLLTELVQLLASGKISDISADSILELFFNGDKRTAKEIVESNNWYIISDKNELEKLCTEVLAAHPKVVKRYIRKGKKQDLNLLLQALLQKTNNRVSVKSSAEIFKRLISKQTAAPKND